MVLKILTVPTRAMLRAKNRPLSARLGALMLNTGSTAPAEALTLKPRKVMVFKASGVLRERMKKIAPSPEEYFSPEFCAYLTLMAQSPSRQ